MTTDLNQFMDTHKELLNEQLLLKISELEAPPKLKDAMSYSLKAGGKRIRPLLLFAVIKSFGKDPILGLPAALALEMIHTYSLIHDDLPSMDNDDLRRGLPTNHKVYGEAMAILAGDGLLTYAFELIAADTSLNPATRVSMIHLLAQCAGPEGMVGGQVADMEGENKSLTINELENIHHRKTGKLLSFAILAGATIGGAVEDQIRSFQQFSYHLGLGFQISDDILDVEGDEDVLGKPVGSDTGRQKSTYPSLLTMEGAKKQLQYHIHEAKAALRETKLSTGLLEQMTDLIAVRTY
ncbi:geranylgeranyl diphosphate synthase type II [Bacillus thermophilus]|uniref:Geranylgeranyl diphosphate synthase type II n=1 Tax=Siminovitchia thermophila TaxID=1245522 RepID=A0ABS2R3M1_9BACI|nr:farnesyl diphosphate synthase [Siminovitchia thermophila]MBM7713764.1 geranylgeranyl diphosphate synthase type II [Siminovitchia thermophila]